MSKSTRKERGVYKRPNSKFWWVCYSTPDGKVIRESSKTTDYREAVAFRAKRITEVQQGKESERILKNYSFRELAERYSEWMKGRHKSADSKQYRIEQLIRYFGELPLKRFSTYLVEQYQTELINKGLKPASVNKNISILKAMFKKAYDWGMITEEILKRVRVCNLLKGEERRLRYLTKAECQALINACEPHLRPIVITALNTGMRRGEILNLTWEQVDLKNGFILLERTKNSEKREIPINETLRQTLQALFRSRRLDIPYVFYDPTTGKPYREVKRSFKTALKNAELQRCPKCNFERAKPKTEVISLCPACGSELETRKGIKDFRFHDLRHTFASHLVMAGVDLTTVKELLGHKDIKMTLRYAHLAPSHKVKAVKIFDMVINGRGTAQKETSTSHLLHILG